jgi:hypothetical protein
MVLEKDPMRKTGSKIRLFVLFSSLFLFVISSALAAIQAAAPNTQPATQPATQTIKPPARGYFVAGQIEDPAISESSGIIQSRKYPETYWTHNDSGNKAEIFAITGKGKLIARFPVNAKNRDWEDITTDDSGHLYIGDIGNNGGRRKQIEIYRLDEPDPALYQKDQISPSLKINKTWRLLFPAEAFDCESLFIWKNHGYVVSKSYAATSAKIHRFPLDEKKDSFVLEQVAQIPIRSPVTSAAISDDGNRLAVLTYTGLSVFQIDGDVVKAQRVAPVYTRLIHAGIEGCCFAPGGVLVSSESRELFFFPEPRKKE